MNGLGRFLFISLAIFHIVWDVEAYSPLRRWSPPAAQLPHYKLRFGDCAGDDIMQIRPANLTTCQEACDKRPECQAFLYVPYLRYSRDYFTPYCWIKHKTCKQLQYSHMRYFWYYDKFVTLGNYTKLMRGCDSPTVASISNVTLDVCKDACDANAHCRAFVYINDKGNKQLKNGGVRCDFKSEHCDSVTKTFNHTFLYTKVSPPVTRPIPNIDCIVKVGSLVAGVHYMGRQNTTKGVKCMRWTDVKQTARLSKERGFLNGRLPDWSIEEAANYCRMPWKSLTGSLLSRTLPYCYIKIHDSVATRQICDIPFCEFDNSTTDIYSTWTDEINVDCLSGSIGADYVGKANFTKSGKSCMKWSLVQNVTARDLPDVTVEDASNYCRNPFKHLDGPWCFVDREMMEWERCDIKMCPHLVNETNCRHTTLGEDYRGRKYKSASGKRCKDWKYVNQDQGILYKQVINVSRIGPWCHNPDLSPNGPWCFVSGNEMGDKSRNNSLVVKGAVRESCGLDYCEGFIPQWLFYPTPEGYLPNQGGEPDVGSQNGSTQLHPLWMVVPVGLVVILVSIALLSAYLKKTNRIHGPFQKEMRHNRFENEASQDNDVTTSGVEEQPF